MRYLIKFNVVLGSEYLEYHKIKPLLEFLRGRTSRFIDALDERYSKQFVIFWLHCFVQDLLWGIYGNIRSFPSFDKSAQSLVKKLRICCLVYRMGRYLI